jgi:hypothetical protein
MKWVLFVIGGLATLVAIVAIIGATLPRTHVASRSLTLRRSPEEIWPAVMQATAASGVPVDVVESDPPRRQVTRVKDTEKMFGGTWTIAITPTPTGGTVTITEDGWVGNPIFRFVSRFVMGHHATMDGMLKEIAKKFGEEPQLAGQ